MKALITGGAGFIGSHLAERLLRQGHQVRIIDDLSTGSLENLRDIRGNPHLECQVGSVLNERAAAKAADGCEVIFHLAAAVGVRLIVESPVRTIETNVKGTEIILELAEQQGQKVILASTSEVYGKSSKLPFSEDDDLVLGPTNRGRWSYACSKALDEFLAQAYWRERQVPSVIVRLFNTVGPRQVGRYGMVLPNFVRQALGNEPITVFGDGLQTRCFCHVSDVAGALIELALHPDAVGQVYNLGSDEEVSIIELAGQVKALTGSRSEIVRIPYREAYSAGFEDMRRRVPDIRKIAGLIGYRPSHSLQQIIESVVEDGRRRQAETQAG